MTQRILTFCEKTTNILPVVGGTTGAIAQIGPLFNYLPTLQAVITTIILGLLGTIVGYFGKLLCDIVFKKLRKKFKV